jgi:hypothetical protein
VGPSPHRRSQGRWGEGLALVRRRRDATRVQRPPRFAAGHSSCATSLTTGGAAAAADSRGTVSPLQGGELTRISPCTANHPMQRQPGSQVAATTS